MSAVLSRIAASACDQIYEHNKAQSSVQDGSRLRLHQSLACSTKNEHVTWARGLILRTQVVAGRGRAEQTWSSEDVGPWPGLGWNEGLPAIV